MTCSSSIARVSLRVPDDGVRRWPRPADFHAPSGDRPALLGSFRPEWAECAECGAAAGDCATYDAGSGWCAPSLCVPSPVFPQWTLADAADEAERTGADARLDTHDPADELEWMRDGGRPAAAGAPAACGTRAIASSSATPFATGPSPSLPSPDIIASASSSAAASSQRYACAATTRR